VCEVVWCVDVRWMHRRVKIWMDGMHMLWTDGPTRKGQLWADGRTHKGQVWADGRTHKGQ
jgi:hypothetical protein